MATVIFRSVQRTNIGSPARGRTFNPLFTQRCSAAKRSIGHSFVAEMWPSKVLHQFKVIPANPREREFHGAYNKLLHILFPPDSDFTVFPQYLPCDSMKSCDFLVTVDDALGDQPMPVLVIELKRPGLLGHMSSRDAADQQIRARMEYLARKPHDTFANAVDIHDV